MYHLKKRMCQRLHIGLLLISFGIVGCGYGEVSQRGYKHATALYAICNRRDAARLDTYAELAENDFLMGEISEQEASWIRAIVAQARDGEWEAACDEVRQVMEDQVEEQ